MKLNSFDSSLAGDDQRSGFDSPRRHWIFSILFQSKLIEIDKNVNADDDRMSWEFFYFIFYTRIIQFLINLTICAENWCGESTAMGKPTAD